MTSIKKNVNLTALHRSTINSVPMHLFCQPQAIQ